MMYQRFKSVLAIIFIWPLMVPFAQALSLGDITLNSALNEPLDAEIAVYSTDSGEILNAYIELASFEVHKNAGMNLNNMPNKVTFKAVHKQDGNFVIQLKTRKPVREPVLEFILEVSGNSGYLRREYAVHLDPPKL